MSYYIYCYQSQTVAPDIEEAQSIIEVFEQDGIKQSDYKRKLEIAKALMACNPGFTKSDYNFDATPTSEEITPFKTGLPCINIQLSPETAYCNIQITIFDNNISLTVPYWYKDIHAEEVFEKLIIYTKIISRIAGYFVYDPQAEVVYDPLKTCFSGLPLYLNLAKKEGKVSN